MEGSLNQLEKGFIVKFLTFIFLLQFTKNDFPDTVPA